MFSSSVWMGRIWESLRKLFGTKQQQFIMRMNWQFCKDQRRGIKDVYCHPNCFSCIVNTSWEKLKIFLTSRSVGPKHQQLEICWWHSPYSNIRGRHSPYSNIRGRHSPYSNVSGRPAELAKHPKWEEWTFGPRSQYKKGGNYMVICKKADTPTCNIRLNNHPLEQVRSFIYLGTYICCDAKSLHEIKKKPSRTHQRYADQQMCII